MKTAIKVLLVVCFVFFLHGFSAFATHQMGSQITYTHLSGSIYEITITTYTYSPSPADRPELVIDWGDGFSSTLPRNYYVEISNTIRKNYYIGVHLFLSEGTYDISFEDPNRNYGIVNIPNSVNVPMYVESRLVIDNNLGVNNSPQLLSHMFGIGYANNTFTYNMGAYDTDGDSLAYKLTYCRGVMGTPIPGYSLPAASTSFEIDSENGDLLWDSPILQGQYCIAIKVEEWRQGVMIGSVIRDMNINIDTANEDDIPVITTISDTVVFPGEVLSFDVSASSFNQNDVSLIGYGGPFIVEQNPAQFSDVIVPVPEASSVFLWEISSSHVREQPYYLYFKASSGSNWSIKESYQTVKILVQEYQSLEENNGVRMIEVSFNNPVNNYLYLNVDCEDPMELFYDIYSTSGQFLLSGNLVKQKSFNKSIRFADFRTGVYILQIHDDNQIFVVKKIVKME